jgi:hypothetical protein
MVVAYLDPVGLSDRAPPKTPFEDLRQGSSLVSLKNLKKKKKIENLKKNKFKILRSVNVKNATWSLFFQKHSWL